MGEIDRFAQMGGRLNSYQDQEAENYVNDPGRGVNPHAHSRIGNILGDLKIQGEGLHCTTGFVLTLN